MDTDSGKTHYVSHWFDGLAHTHRFDIVPDSSGGASVTYSSRRQADGLIKDIRRRGWRSTISFGQRADPCMGLFAKAQALFQAAQSDISLSNNNVTVLPGLAGLSSGADKTKPAASSFFIGSDTATLQELDPRTLEPVRYVRQTALHPDLEGPMSAAHPPRDPENGDWFNFNLHIGRTVTYRVFRVDAATGRTEILASIAGLLQPAYIHSMFLTQNYVLLCVPTSHFSLGGVSVPLNRNIADSLKPFDAANAMQWVVVDRRHGRGVVARFSMPAGFFFHSTNAWEEVVTDDEGRQRTDICFEDVHYDTTDIIFTLYYDVILDREGAAAKAYLEEERHKTTLQSLVRHRFRMPLADDGIITTNSNNSTATATQDFSIPTPHVGELPTINPLYACRPHRYVYSCARRGLGTLFDCLVKTDTQTREALMWNPPTAHSPGEPIFVPRPRPAAVDGKEGEERAEDDGVLLSVVLDGSAQKSYLLCLDAATMKELGRADADFAVGIGFHGAHTAQAA